MTINDVVTCIGATLKPIVYTYVFITYLYAKANQILLNWFQPSQCITIISLFILGTLLAKKKLKIKFTDDEIICILRAYIAQPTSWTDVISDVKGNFDRLPDTTRHLYTTVTTKQLRDRMSTKLSSLMGKDADSVKNEQIRYGILKLSF